MQKQETLGLAPLDTVEGCIENVVETIRHIYFQLTMMSDIFLGKLRFYQESQEMFAKCFLRYRHFFSLLQDAHFPQKVFPLLFRSEALEIF